MDDHRCNFRNQVDYSVEEILFVCISAAVSGCTSWNAIHGFAEDRLDWLRQYFPYKNGPIWPSTLSRFFAKFDHQAFSKCFIEWVSKLHDLEVNQVVTIDGKTMRESVDTSNNKASAHMVSAFVSHQNLCLGQVATEEKSNEITAIPQLLNLLTLEGCTVTINAMGCQKEIAQVF